MSKYLEWCKSHCGHSEMKQQAKKEIDKLTERLAKANERVESLKRELEKETIRKNASFRYEDLLTEENKKLRRQRFRTYNDEEYIIFFDDGEDFPESMVAPVVMGAEKFRELFYAREQLRKGQEK